MRSSKFLRLNFEFLLHQFLDFFDWIQVCGGNLTLEHDQLTDDVVRNTRFFLPNLLKIVDILGIYRRGTALNPKKHPHVQAYIIGVESDSSQFCLLFQTHFLSPGLWI